MQPNPSATKDWWSCVENKHVISLLQKYKKKFKKHNFNSILGFEFMDRNPQKGERGIMLSFGPGFSAQRILLEW